MTDLEAVRAGVAAADGALGPLDVLVNNCTHAVVGGMCERGHGRVVTISSEAGRLGLGIGVSLYGAAEAGPVGLMRHLAVEVAPAGVAV